MELENGVYRPNEITLIFGLSDSKEQLQIIYQLPMISGMPHLSLISFGFHLHVLGLGPEQRFAT